MYREMYEDIKIQFKMELGVFKVSILSMFGKFGFYMDLNYTLVPKRFSLAASCAHTSILTTICCMEGSTHAGFHVPLVLCHSRPI